MKDNQKFKFDSWEADFHYLIWLIEYWCLNHEDLKKVIKIVEDMTEEYHDPYR